MRRKRCTPGIPGPFDTTSGDVMAVPKKKTSKAKSRSRRSSAWRIRSSGRSSCPRCNSVKRPHTVCDNCGWYGGRQAIDVD